MAHPSGSTTFDRAASRRHLIVDTDPGVDDAFAIALAALDPGVELLAVTSVYGNVPLPATTRNALGVLALCGRSDVPVAAGAGRPLIHPHPHVAPDVHGSDGLSGHADALPAPSRTAEGGAVARMASLIESSDEPVTIAAIGPLTNIALLLAAFEHVKGQIERIVIMGGAIDGGNVTARAEFNVWSDPEAARRVLVEEDVPVTLVPLDLTYRCAVDETWLDTLAASGPIGAALHALTPDYREHYAKALGWPGMVIHDAVAVAEAMAPGTLATRAMQVDVECSFGPARGSIIADRRRRELAAATEPLHGRPVDVAVDTDVDALLSRMHTALARP